MTTVRYIRIDKSAPKFEAVGNGTKNLRGYESYTIKFYCELDEIDTIALTKTSVSGSAPEMISTSELRPVYNDEGTEIAYYAFDITTKGTYTVKVTGVNEMSREVTSLKVR